MTYRRSIHSGYNWKGQSRLSELNSLRVDSPRIHFCCPVFWAYISPRGFSPSTSRQSMLANRGKVQQAPVGTDETFQEMATVSLSLGTLWVSVIAFGLCQNRDTQHRILRHLLSTKYSQHLWALPFVWNNCPTESIFSSGVRLSRMLLIPEDLKF